MARILRRMRGTKDSAREEHIEFSPHGMEGAVNQVDFTEIAHNLDGLLFPR